MKRNAGLVFALALIVGAAASGHAQEAGSELDCLGRDRAADYERRISGCTALLESGLIANQAQVAAIYAMRGLAFSLKRDYAAAVRDYDLAIGMQPDFAAALNNRAWAYFRWGKPATALPDVEASLRLEPTEANALDTRAHIRQLQGDQKGALRDYTQAIYFGGLEMVKLYQCGLTEAGLYEGRIDGVWRRELQDAMEKCVASTTCDPLPADEHCRPATS
jgi:tetratricopeptide (TPR) repeat protein